MKSQFKMIQKPYITEKVVTLKEESNKVVFKVSKKTNKVELKNAIESIFKVTVQKIATVTLKEGDTIEYFEGA